MLDLLARLQAPFHRRLVAGRRVRALAQAVEEALPEPGLHGLDIGCGTGQMAILIPKARFEGCDVLVRPDAHIPVTAFDGTTLPYPDGSFDFTMLVDVLHHLDDPLPLLLEARRVSRRFVLVKDHYCENAWQRLVLRFMDWVGNRAYGVALPYNYLSRKHWSRLFQEAGLTPVQSRERLGLYPWPFSRVFESGLHFLTQLRA